VHTHHSSMSTIRVAIVGASGYAGAELLAILAGHPNAAVAGLFGSSRKAEEGTPTAADLFPRFEATALGALKVEPFTVDAAKALDLDAIFLATPHELSHEVSQALVDAGIVVLDLSAAFRLSDRGVFEKNYGFAHQFPALLGEAAYGLAEFNDAAVAKARLVAVPGCYDRGILATVHLELKPGTTEAQVRAAFDAAYANRPFVRVLKAGRWPSISSVERTNFCDIGFALENSDHGTHLIVESAIDNLVKGAAGQAVQCMNIRFGFDEAAGFQGTAAGSAVAGGAA